MKRYLIAGLAILISFGSIAYAAQPIFTSPQVGANPSNGFVLQTNGLNSTWVATSTLGFSSGGGGTGTISTSSPLVSGQPIYATGANTIASIASSTFLTSLGGQVAGNYITALTGDITASGPGSTAATLATVNGNVGSFTNANITVNAKGLITAASNGTTGSPYPFPLPGNATSSVVQFNSGIGSYGSTTIGSGTGNMLTINGDTNIGTHTIYGNSFGSGDSLTMNGASGYTLLNGNNGWGINLQADKTTLLPGGAGQVQLQWNTDTNISRYAAGVLEFGNGTYQDESGSFLAASSTIKNLTAALTFNGAGLSSCASANNALTWASGVFGCNTITAGSSFAYPFPNNATSTLLNFFGNASTSQFTSTSTTYLATRTGHVFVGTTTDSYGAGSQLIIDGSRNNSALFAVTTGGTAATFQDNLNGVGVEGVTLTSGQGVFGVSGNLGIGVEGTAGTTGVGVVGITSGGIGGEFTDTGGGTALKSLQGNVLLNTLSGNTGIGTTSPYAKLSVMAGGDYASHPLSTVFAIGSSTAGAATSTLLALTSDGSLFFGNATDQSRSYMPVPALGRVTSGDLNQFYEQVNNLLPTNTGLINVFSIHAIANLPTLATSHFNALNVTAESTSSMTANLTNLIGIQSSATMNGSGNVAFFMDGVVGNAFHNGTGNVNEASGGVFQVGNFNTGTITSGSGVDIFSDNGAAGGGITNEYGLIIDPQTAGTNRWGIYDNSGDADYFSGNVGIGSTTPGSLLSIGNTGTGINFTLATSTFTTSGGINLTSGCFSVAGVCGSGTVGAGTTGQFPYYAANGTALTATSSIFIGTTGNIGIGTTSPGALLTIQGSANSPSVAYTPQTGTAYKTQNLSVLNANGSVASTNYANAVFDTQANSLVSSGLIQGIVDDVSDASTVSGNQPNLTGEIVNTFHLGSGTIATEQGINFGVRNSSASTVTSALGLSGSFTNNGIGATTTTATVLSATLLATGAFGAITNANGLAFNIQNSNANSTITNLDAINIGGITNTGTIASTTGVFIGNLTAGTQTNHPYSVYSADPNAWTYMAGNVGIGTTSPMSALSLNGSINQYGSGFNHFGTIPSIDPFYCTSANQCLVNAGSDNTLNGVEIEDQNASPGAHAYAVYTLQNNLTDNTGTHYASWSLNGNGYNDSSFGSALNSPNLSQFLNTDGATVFGTNLNATTTANSNYFSWIEGGSSTSNELMHLNPTGLGIGTSSPFARLSVNGSSLGTMPLFSVASSSAAATTTVFQIDNLGNLTSAGEFSINDTTLTSRNALNISETMPAGVAGISSSATGANIQITYAGASANQKVRGLSVLSAFTGTVNNTATNSGQFPGGANGAIYTSANNSAGINLANSIALAATIQVNNGGGSFASTTNGIAFSATAPTVASTSLLTNYYGYKVAGATSEAGVITNGAGLNIESLLLTATNTTEVLLGTASIPSGNYGIYQSDTLNDYLAGKLGIGTTSPWTNLGIVGTVAINGLVAAAAGNDVVCINPTTLELFIGGGGTTCAVSNEKYKEDIATSTAGIDELMKLNVVSFYFKNASSTSGEPAQQLGFLANQVFSIDSRITQQDASGTPNAIRYDNLDALITKSMQDIWGHDSVQDQQIAQLQAEVAALQARQAGQQDIACYIP